MFLALAENSIQLVPDGTLFFHIILLILMVYILNVTLFRPINRILEERERQTSGQMGNAQAILNQVQLSIERYEQILRAARAEGYNFLEKQRASAMSERQGLLNSLREDLRTSSEEQKHLIQAQAGRARVQLEKDSYQIAVAVSQQVLRRDL
jgi:F-type H+-transporting ATPase subunit b